MNPIQKLIGEAEEDFSEYEDLLALDAEQEKTLFNRELPMTPEEAYLEAADLFKGNVPEELEKIIATNAEYSYLYALVITREPFPLGEPSIATSPEWSYLYARYVLEARFPQGEPAIATSALHSYEYARDILKARFPEGEPAISRKSEYRTVYNKLFKIK